MWPMSQRVRSSIAGAFNPLTDGPFADAEPLGNLALGPALLFEVPSMEPSGFFPVVGCTVHTWEYITATSRALAFYARVSKFSAVVVDKVSGPKQRPSPHQPCTAENHHESQRATERPSTPSPERQPVCWTGHVSP